MKLKKSFTDKLPSKTFINLRLKQNKKILLNYIGNISKIQSEDIEITPYGTYFYELNYYQFNFMIEDWGKKLITLDIVNVNNKKRYQFSCPEMGVINLIINDFINRVK
jgi:hypothetical protein